MKAYLYDVFHRCESITDWEASSCVLALSSTQKVEGKYSIKQTSNDDSFSFMHYFRNLDWSEFPAIIFSVYHPGWTNETGFVGIYTDALNYKIWTFDFAGVWTKIEIDFSSAPRDSVGTLDLSDITYISIGEENLEDPGEDYYYDFFYGKVDVTSDITYVKITEEMGTPSFAELKIKGESLDHFQAGLEMEVYDKDDVLSWTGRILYPESVLVGKDKTIGKLKALGSNSQFNNAYRKNFTTARSSDYIAKHVIDNALPKFNYGTKIDDFSALTYKYDMKTKIQKLFNYLAMLERGVIGYDPGGEMFFNKYDNLSKGPQIYQGTYNFGDEAVGTTDDDIDFFDTIANQDADTSISVIASFDGHKKVLKLVDDNAVGRLEIQHAIGSTEADATIEFCFGISDITSTMGAVVRLKEGATIICEVFIDNNDLDTYTGGAFVSIKDNFIIADQLFRVKMVLDDTANTFDCFVNGVNEGTFNYRNNSITGINIIELGSGQDDVLSVYWDAFGFSWDANYDVGDNLKCWDESTKKIRITSYTPVANRHVTRTPVIGANNDLGQVYYVGKASDALVQKYGINQLQPWRDSEITNYAEAKQLGDNLLVIYSMDTQMISMLVVGKGHLQVAKTLNLGWAGVFSITQKDFLLTKRVWYPIPDISELELTDNILTKKAFNIRIINKFYDEDAQQSYEEPDVAESTVDGTVENLHSVAQLRSPTYLDAVIAAVPGDNLGNHTAIQTLNMATHKITNVVDPVADQDAATKKSVEDSSKVGVSSDDLIFSNDATQGNATGTPTKVKEILVYKNLKCRIYHEMRTSIGGTSWAHSRVYVNGGAVGATHDSNTTDWTAYTDDIEVVYGDDVQIYAWETLGAGTSEVKNMRIKFIEYVSNDP